MSYVGCCEWEWANAHVAYLLTLALMGLAISPAAAYPMDYEGCGHGYKLRLLRPLPSLSSALLSSAV
jgi:hypothetical protein